MGMIRSKPNGAAYFIADSCDACKLLALLPASEMELSYVDGYVQTVPIVWDELEYAINGRSTAPAFVEDDK